uniref:FBA_2 domain-containing protein n=2 Tax=Bursaphelenchus xylophilus TaxID=6326 RepID=A0A1I7S6R5_BURXY
MRTTMDKLWVKSRYSGICLDMCTKNLNFSSGVSNWLVRTIFAWTNPVSISLILEEYTDFLEQLLGGAKPTIKRLRLETCSNWPERQIARFLGKSVDYLECDLEFLGLSELMGARIGELKVTEGVLKPEVVMENDAFRGRDPSFLCRNLHNVSARTIHFEIVPYDTMDRPIEATTHLVFHDPLFFFQNYSHAFEKFPNLQSVALIYSERRTVVHNLVFGLTKMFEEGFLEKWREKNVTVHLKGTDILDGIRNEPSFVQSELLARTNGQVAIEHNKSFIESIHWNNFRITFQNANVEVDVLLKLPCFPEMDDFNIRNSYRSY